MLAAYWVASLVVRHRGWLLTDARLPWLIFLATGIAVTIVFEYLATGMLQRWTYAPTMPTLPLVGTGLAPLLQWLLLPPLALRLTAKHIAGSGARNTTGF